MAPLKRLGVVDGTAFINPVGIRCATCAEVPDQRKESEMTKEKTEQAVETEVKAAAVEEAKKDEVKANPLEHTIDLTISAAEVQKLADTQLKRYAKNARMPGFRRGHVPMAQVRAMYGLQAFEEAVNEKVGEAWAKAARESGLEIAGAPRIEPVDSENKEEMKFQAVFEVFPTIEIPDFSTVSLKRYGCTVDEAAVEKTLDVMRRQRVVFEAAEEGREAQDEDRVTINFEGKKEGVPFAGGSAEGFVFTLGAKRMLPEFEAAVKGMKVGEKKTFPLTFPENYGPKELNGAQVEFEVELTKLEKANLPEVNDDFAKMLGVEGGVEAMRQEIRANLEREVKSRIDVKNRTEVFETLAKTLTFAVPAALIDNEAASLRDNLIRVLKARNPKGRQIEKSVPAVDAFRAEAENRVRLGLFVAELSAKEKLAATEEAVKEAAKTIASSYQEPDDVVSYLLNDQASRNQLFNQVQEENIARWVLEHAKTEDVAVDFDAVMAGQL